MDAFAEYVPYLCVALGALYACRVIRLSLRAQPFRSQPMTVGEFLLAVGEHAEVRWYLNFHGEVRAYIDGHVYDPITGACLCVTGVHFSIEQRYLAAYKLCLSLIDAERVIAAADHKPGYEERLRRELVGATVDRDVLLYQMLRAFESDMQEFLKAGGTGST